MEAAQKTEIIIVKERNISFRNYSIYFNQVSIDMKESWRETGDILTVFSKLLEIDPMEAIPTFLQDGFGPDRPRIQLS